MAYRVELPDGATGDLELLFLEKNATDSPAAARWLNRLDELCTPWKGIPFAVGLLGNVER